ncbi:hypothetical protein D1872_36900 [compost metagenome]
MICIMKPFKREITSRNSIQDKIQYNLELTYALGWSHENIKNKLQGTGSISRTRISNIYDDLFVYHKAETQTELSRLHNISGSRIGQNLNSMYRLSMILPNEVIRDIIGISHAKLITELNRRISSYIQGENATIQDVVDELSHVRSLINNAKTLSILTATLPPIDMYESHTMTYARWLRDDYIGKNQKICKSFENFLIKILLENEIISERFIRRNPYLKVTYMSKGEPVIIIDLWRDSKFRILLYCAKRGEYIVSIDSSKEIDIPELDNITSNLSDWENIRRNDECSINMEKYIFPEYQKSKTKFTIIVNNNMGSYDVRRILGLILSEVGKPISESYLIQSNDSTW